MATNYFQKATFFTDPSFFTLFDFNLVKGNNSNPFPGDNSIVITETTAKRYFGDDDPLGKIIVADNKNNFTVSGVIRDFPKNSSIHGDIFFPMSLFNKLLHEGRPGENIDNDWEQFNYITYLLLRPGTNVQDLANKIRDIHLSHEPGDSDIRTCLNSYRKCICTKQMVPKVESKPFAYSPSSHY